MAKNHMSGFKDKWENDKLKTDTEKLRKELWRIQKVWQSPKNIFKKKVETMKGPIRI